MTVPKVGDWVTQEAWADYYEVVEIIADRMWLTDKDNSNYTYSYPLCLPNDGNGPWKIKQ